MSDEFERETQNLGNALLGIYILITRVCGFLPIPISLPTFEEDVLHGEQMIEGVTRVIDLIEDEPIDEDLQAGIWGGCLHWLSAAHLYNRWMEHHEHLVSLEIRINLVTGADALHAVAHELIDPQE
ncbi:hypothetical protein ACFWR9_11455 [Streptomyces sp. NPDC058534]|uniref:hypothetical protein n=1 Tax=Streptomyces sp. NPDC058534 TaxID=3346541 RepID=UPI00365EA759